jgi:hypothetical protein
MPLRPLLPVVSLIVVCLLSACARTPSGMSGVWAGPNGLRVTVADDRIDVTRPDPARPGARVSTGGQDFSVNEAGGRAYRIEFPARRLLFKDMLFYRQTGVLTAYDLDNRELLLRRLDEPTAK